MTRPTAQSGRFHGPRALAIVGVAHDGKTSIDVESDYLLQHDWLSEFPT